MGCVSHPHSAETHVLSVKTVYALSDMIYERSIDTVGRGIASETQNCISHVIDIVRATIRTPELFITVLGRPSRCVQMTSIETRFHKRRDARANKLDAS